MSGTVGRPMTKGPSVRFFSFHLIRTRACRRIMTAPPGSHCPNELYDPALA